MGPPVPRSDQVLCTAPSAPDSPTSASEKGRWNSPPVSTLTLVANSIPCSRGRLQRGESGATGPGYRPPRPPVVEAHHINRRRRQEVLEMRLRLPDVPTPP